MTNKEIREGLKEYFNIEGTELAEILGYGDYMVQEHLATKVDKDINNPKTKFYFVLRKEMKKRGKFWDNSYNPNNLPKGDISTDNLLFG